MGREGRGRKVKRRERGGGKGEESEVLGVGGEGRGRRGQELLRQAWTICALCHYVCVSLLHSLIAIVSLSSPPPVPGLPEFDRGYSVPLSDDDSVNGLSVTHFTMEDAESKATGVEYFCASDARWVCLYCTVNKSVCVCVCVCMCSITHVVVTSDDKE